MKAREAYESYFEQSFASFYETDERIRLANLLIRSHGIENVDLALRAIGEIEANRPENVLDCVNLSMANGILQDDHALREQIEIAISALISVIGKANPASRCHNRLEWISRLRDTYSAEEVFGKACFCYASCNLSEASSLLELNAKDMHFPSMRCLVILSSEMGDHEKVFYYTLAIERVMRAQYHIAPDLWINRLMTQAEGMLSSEVREEILARAQSIAGTAFRTQGSSKTTIRGFAIES